MFLKNILGLFDVLVYLMMNTRKKKEINFEKGKKTYKGKRFVIYVNSVKKV